jgi:hypothetical protein
VPKLLLRRQCDHHSGLAGHEWIDDMCQLSWLFYERQADLLTLLSVLGGAACSYLGATGTEILTR